ncbi:hypothetical protein NQ318_019441 [Aromia moschata]|uniref:Fatty acyl-CoA reductase C-terminal domain-containing protein n=1 Tax=Aromia moschata TaxID=1265417 RepID=A0AAV8XKY4_9CUCU|nr:hypothetical protein NQ318_019441 [Aromia moschata]
MKYEEERPYPRDVRDTHKRNRPYFLNVYNYSYKINEHNFSFCLLRLEAELLLVHCTSYGTDNKLVKRDILYTTAIFRTMNDNKETQDRLSREEKFDKEIPVYNFVSSPEMPITWGKYCYVLDSRLKENWSDTRLRFKEEEGFQELSTKHCKQIPSEKCIWHSFFFMIPNKNLHTIAVFLFHTIPSHLVDFFSDLYRKDSNRRNQDTVLKHFRLVKAYQKINKFAGVLAYFCMREWEFKNVNTRALWQRMKKQDKELFEFSMKDFNWDLYFYTYTRGCRAYILKDPPGYHSPGCCQEFSIHSKNFLEVEETDDSGCATKSSCILRKAFSVSPRIRTCLQDL